MIVYVITMEIKERPNACAIRYAGCNDNWIVIPSDALWGLTFGCTFIWLGKTRIHREHIFWQNSWAILSHPGIPGGDWMFCSSSHAAAADFCSCENFLTTFQISFIFRRIDLADCLTRFLSIFVVASTFNFSRSNMEFAISQQITVRLAWNKKQTYRLNSNPQMWP